MSADPQLLVMLALLASGALAGLLAGLLGVGGGIVIVPVLYYVFGFIDAVDPSASMHLAVGTSLAAMIPTSIRSALKHRAKGAVDVALFQRWLPFLLAGAATGALFSVYLKGPMLMAVFAIFASVVAVHMMFGKESWRLAPTLPGEIGQAGMAALIAGVSVMMGIGGGTFTVPVLTLFGYPIHRAVGTAAAIGVVIAVPGAIGFILGGLGEPGRPPGSFGYSSLVGVVMIVPATVVTAPWGAALAHRLNRIWLRKAFALFLGVTGLRMALNLF